VTLHGSPPLVIAHRGASGRRPEHSAGAYRLACRLGADAVELDLVPTRDGELVCRHDLELSRTTDVASRREFAGRRRTLDLDGRAVTGWFVHDFTLDELRTLRCVERWPHKRPGSAAYDGTYPLLTLGEACELVDAEATRRGAPVEVYAELKHPAYLGSLGLDPVVLVAGVRRPRLTWMSFEEAAVAGLRAAGHTRLVRLLDTRPTDADLAAAAGHATAIGVRRTIVLPRTDRRVGAPSDLVARAHDHGLEVLVWTHRAENSHLPENLRVGRGKRAHGLARREAELFFEAEVDGLISDFPEIAVAARDVVTRGPSAGGRASVG
jgi:glycerophosphoryl diester phosphodiesterase